MLVGSSYSRYLSKLLIGCQKVSLAFSSASFPLFLYSPLHVSACADVVFLFDLFSSDFTSVFLHFSLKSSLHLLFVFHFFHHFSFNACIHFSPIPTRAPMLTPAPVPAPTSVPTHTSTATPHAHAQACAHAHAPSPCPCQIKFLVK